jgi:hypothetical protein
MKRIHKKSYKKIIKVCNNSYHIQYILIEQDNNSLKTNKNEKDKNLHS